jgi:tRNA-2-methylthio-N6-dimethylallyladenosine synthase
VPDIAISTDIIVGYPGETEADFEATLDVVRKVRFANAFTFLYSKRSGTPAAERTDVIPPKTVSERYDRLVAELSPILLETNQAKVDRVFETIVEEIAETDYKGRTDDHTLVHFTSDTPLKQGDIVPVKVTHARTFYVTGERV